MFSWLKKLTKYWPYLAIISVTGVYFAYLLVDSRYFFYDDFTGFTFSVPRTYWQIIVDSLHSRSVDRHKFIGYLITKWLYHRAGTEVNFYFLTLFLIHTINSFLVFKLLKRLTQKPLTSLFLTLVYAYRFYLWWFSNIHMMVEGFFLFTMFHFWLNYLETKRPFWLPLVWLTYLLAVFGYGPAILFAPALVLFTPKNLIKPLLPMLALVPLYLFIFTFTEDTMTRFTGNNPYTPDFSFRGLVSVQAQYLSALSGGVLPVQPLLAILIWSNAFFLTLKYRPRLVLWLLAFALTIAANSFFPAHTMFYYLYPPIIFLLIYFALLLQEKLWPVFLLLFLILFNPFHELYRVAFRLKHPSVNFERRAMSIIVAGVQSAINGGETQVKLSNWEVTPNLAGAVDYLALPLFMTHPRKNDFRYGYNRQTETLTLTPCPPELSDSSDCGRALYTETK